MRIGAALQARIRSGMEDRNQAITRFAHEMERDPTAVGRMLRAYEYVSRHPADIPAVRAPFASIEVLARIERLDAVRAALIHDTVLLGNMTTAELRALEQQLIVANEDVPEHIRQLTLQQILEVCDSCRALKVEFELTKYSGVSHTTAWVGANVQISEGLIEIEGIKNDPCSWVLVISPSIHCSRLAGLKFDDLLSSTVKCLWFYKTVSVFCANRTESDQIKAFFSLHHADPGPRLIFHHWDDCPSVSEEPA